MTWNAEDAPQQFPAILSAAEQEPQLIHQQNHLVAAVIRADLFQKFLVWQQQQQPSLADAFAELRQLCIEEDYTFEIPARQNRPNPC